MPRPMVTELMKLKAEAEQLLALYTEYHDSDDPDKRRRAHLNPDRFLMEHREVALILMINSLSDEIAKMLDKTRPDKKINLLSRILLVIRQQYNA